MLDGLMSKAIFYEHILAVSLGGLTILLFKITTDSGQNKNVLVHFQMSIKP